jgi:hypothetical protein
MQGSELTFLSQWQNFYMIMVTAAATLTRLMFVVTTLIAGIRNAWDMVTFLSASVLMLKTRARNRDIVVRPGHPCGVWIAEWIRHRQVPVVS